MFGSREDIRQVYYNVWQKIKDNNVVLEPMETIVSDIIKLHPEYHSMLDDPKALEKDFMPEEGKTNPFLHMGMHIAIREQITTDRPEDIKAFYMKQCKKVEVHDVEHKMMECLAQTMWLAQRNNTDFDEVGYMECIKK